MLPPLRFDDPRHERIHRRLALLGDGPAAFFRDALRIADSNVGLETATHLISHLLREIESALRYVLEPIAHHKQIKKKSAKKRNKPRTSEAPAARATTDVDQGHRDEILVILNALQLPLDGEVAAAWLNLAERSHGLAGRAHRRALARPRPMSTEFNVVWEHTLMVLDAVLAELEARYIELHNVIDRLVAKEIPEPGDLEVLAQQLPHNIATRKYFFENLTHSGWFEPLAEAGFFSDPPPATPPDEKGLIGFPWWPASEYLKLMASLPEHQSHVVAVLLKLPALENPRTVASVAEIALQLPSKLSVALADVLVAGVSAISIDFMSESLGRLMSINAFGARLFCALPLMRFVDGASSQSPPARD